MSTQPKPEKAADLATTSATFNGVKLSTRTMPAQSAERGGDWCEAFVISHDVLAISIGDVLGHGDDCFQTMVATREAIREAARNGFDPARTLATASAFLRGYDPPTHATAIFALLDTRQRSVTFANAGHPPPLMAGPDGSRLLEFPDCDLPLGVGTTAIPMHTIGLPPDTLLVFYTDGVTEHQRDPLGGEEQLRHATSFAYRYASLPSALVIERQMFLTGPNRDDAAILTAWTPRRLWVACD
jgi:serine phosphatase RsbU (regulator of sigma subunit)